MTMTVPSVATISNVCECEDYNEETGESTPSYDCFGCYEDSLEYLKSEILEPWLEANDLYDNSRLKVSGEAMGWTRASGWTHATPLTLINALALRGEFTLKFIYAEGSLTVVRYSHDEPTGALFTVVSDPEVEEDED